MDLGQDALHAAGQRSCVRFSISEKAADYTSEWRNVGLRSAEVDLYLVSRFFLCIHSSRQYSRSLVGYGIAWASRSTAGFGRPPRPLETTVVKESEWFCGFSFYPIPAIDGVFACGIEWTVLLFVFIRLSIHVDWNSSSWLVSQPVTTKDLPDKKRVLKSFFFFFHSSIVLFVYQNWKGSGRAFFL